MSAYIAYIRMQGVGEKRKQFVLSVLKRYSQVFSEYKQRFLSKKFLRNHLDRVTKILFKAEGSR